MTGTLGPLHIEPSGWDAALIVAVTAMVAVMALLRTPRRKALVLSVPLPFTIATLAVGRPIDATHVAALWLLFSYTLAVYLSHRRLGLALLPSSALAAAGFIACGSVLNLLLPNGEAAFWIAVVATLLAAVVMLRALPVSREAGVRVDLPLARKLPMVALVVAALVVLKGVMGGFMTLFPMVGVVASFENRHGLWANVRQVPVVMLTMLPLMVTTRLLEPSLGVAGALVLGWIPFALVLAPFARRAWGRYDPVITELASSNGADHAIARP